MNRRITALTIAAVAVLGLTACGGTTANEDPAADEDANSSSPAEETSEDSGEETTGGDQSVAEACGIVIPELTEASDALSGIDPSTAAEDAQATLDQFNEFVDALGATADKVTNVEVKEATVAVHTEFAGLSEILRKVIVDQDLSAAGDLSTVQSDMIEAATELQTICAG